MLLLGLTRESQEEKKGGEVHVSCFLFPQTYVTSSDKDFAAATIQAIGRCASSISEVTDTCLNGLVHLMSNRDGESVLSTR